MNEIRQKIATSYNRKGVKLDRIEPYDPYLTNNGINKYKLSPTAYSSGYTRVNDTSEFPYRVTCRITVDVYGVQRGGTVFLVGPNILLTAAHCVMNQEDNDNLFANWIAYPGYNNGTYKGISSGWSRIYYSPNWKNGHANQDDWCLCILNNSIGSQVGWYGSMSYGSSSDMKNLEVKALGYPESPGHTEYQMFSTGTLSNISSGKFDMSAPISEGMSGGPISRTSDYYAVGIIKGYYTFRPETSIGVRITEDIINLIRENT